MGRESLDQLLRRLRPRLKQVLGRYRIPAHDAEDLVQEALISTIQKWDVIQDPEAWLLVTLWVLALARTIRRGDPSQSEEGS